MEYVTRGVCGQEGCRQRRYYLDNGLWFCRRGHLQEVCILYLACSAHSAFTTLAEEPAHHSLLDVAYTDSLYRVNKLKKTRLILGLEEVRSTR